MASQLLRRAMSAPVTGPRCCDCGRSPLAGEVLHVFDGGRSLCTLCARGVPDADFEAARHVRIHVAERRLPVAPRAA